MVTEGPRPPLVVYGPADDSREQDILQGILALSDPEARITALWHLSHRRLLGRVLRRQLPLEVAEDIVQDVFSLLADQLERVCGPRILGWLNTMVDYECARRFSERRRALANQRAVVTQQLSLDLHSSGQPERQLDSSRDLAVALELLVTLEPLDELIMGAAGGDAFETAQLIERIQGSFGLLLTPRALYERRRRIRRDLANRLANRRRGSSPRGDHD